MKKLLSIAIIIASMSSCVKDQPTEVKYQVNDVTSNAKWLGAATDHFHVGSFKVTGSLSATKDGKVTTGNFTIPIASIQDFDLPDPVRQQLLADLKSANFFNLAVHPNANFKITKVGAYTQSDTSAVAGANYLLTGDFSMVGQTHSISFPAKITLAGDSIKTEAKFKIDRNKWGMTIYNDPSKALYILPDVRIHLKVQAAKTK